MKKIAYLCLICLMLVGCSTKIDTNPREEIEAYLADEYPNATVLAEKTKENYHTILLEDGNEVTLVIFELNNGVYQYFGGSNYNENEGDYGRYDFKQEQYLMIVYAKNTDLTYTNLTLQYTNINEQGQQITIHDPIDRENFIQIFLLPTEYEYQSIELT